MIDRSPRDAVSKIIPSHSPSRGTANPHRLTFYRSTSNPQAHSPHVDHQTMHTFDGHEPNDSPISRSQTFPNTLAKVPSNISSRRGLEFSIPRFEEISVPGSDSLAEMTNTTCRPCDLNTLGRLIKATSSQPATRHGSQGPPTPPNEVDFLAWIPDAPTEPLQAGSVDGSRGSTSLEPATALSGIQQCLNSQNINNTSQPNEFSSLSLRANPWLYRALRIASAPLESQLPTMSAKVISQVLPPSTSDRRQVKTYEVVCEHLQCILPEPQYVSITHALTVSASQVVEDFPKSPPSTPSFSRRDNYFGDQTVFTHAAQVPMYHESRIDVLNLVAAPPQRHIMIAEANLVVLERYIPPTTAEETVDFFDADSCRSYLIDRLPELAADVGSLILVYPTKTGAETFAQRYVGPVLDPLLREMTILKGLNTNAAEALGSMKGLESMYEFDEMQSKVQGLCASMNARLAIQKSRTEFQLAHSEAAHVTLDRKTWTTWFVEQEQIRLRQNLIDYHRDGGRLPGGSGSNTELTVGMLTREITEGFRRSKMVAGGAEIEVGVFVIRRHKRSAAP